MRCLVHPKGNGLKVWGLTVSRCYLLIVTFPSPRGQKGARGLWASWEGSCRSLPEENVDQGQRRLTGQVMIPAEHLLVSCTQSWSCLWGFVFSGLGSRFHIESGVSYGDVVS